MIIYQATKAQFLEDVWKGDIDEIVERIYRDRTQHRTPRSELAAWRSSLFSMAKVLGDDEIPHDCGVAVEYVIRQSRKRIDFMLTGYSQGKTPCAIIVELKQWSSARRTEKDGVVVAWYGGGETEANHPSYQAWSYSMLLKGFSEAVYDGGITLHPCAYLHNYTADDVIAHDCYKLYVDEAPLFLRGEVERSRFRAFIKQCVVAGDGGSVIEQIEASRMRTSKALADSIDSMLRGNREFVLIDDQKLVYETALACGRHSSSGRKSVYIVEGGPGTGKSVVAINLLARLNKEGIAATKYVSKNAAPRKVYESKLSRRRRGEISGLFYGSGDFIKAEPREFDVLIVDEAHRLNAKSGFYRNFGENQIKEIISASKCTIFFIDEDQRVTLDDIGSKDEIRKWAHALGAEVSEGQLSSQFRCNGSDGYLAWLDDTLQVRPTANERLEPEEFDFQVLDSPEDVRKLIVEKNALANKARMVAGYCWRWKSKKQSDAMDVEIPKHGFAMQWNLTSDGSLWIVAPQSIDQIGCIHTSQGLDLDYIGVVVGPDLIVRDGKVITVPEKRDRFDSSIRGYKKLMRADPETTRARVDAVIKNTYRALMTRAMKGCYVYCTDEETASYFRARIAPSKPLDVAPVHTQQAVSAPAADEPFARLRPRDVRPYVNCVPLIDLKFAAGGFSASQAMDVDACEWVQLPDHFRPHRGLFVAQVMGQSMSGRIPDGSWCLFRLNPAGTRAGKVVVVQRRSSGDPEDGGTYTIKVYESEKAREGDGSTERHVKISLKPSRAEKTYEPIVLEPDATYSDEVVAVLEAVLG